MSDTGVSLKNIFKILSDLSNRWDLTVKTVRFLVATV